VVQIILNNGSLDFVNEMQEAGIIPFGVEFKNPDFAKVAEAMGATGIRIEEPATFGKDLLQPLRTREAGRRRCGSRSFRPVAAVARPFHTATGYTLSLAKQVLSGKMDAVIKTIERNVKLI